MNTITVTDKTTLGELFTFLDLAEKSGKTPTPKELFETAGDPIAETNDCTRSATALQSIRISPDAQLCGCRTAKASLSILIS